MIERETIVLSHPIQFGKDTITELQMRRGQAGDLKGIKVGGNGMDCDDLLMIAARMAGQPPALIAKLDEEDAGEVLGRALAFFGRCLSTGPRLSESLLTSSTSDTES